MKTKGNIFKIIAIPALILVFACLALAQDVRPLRDDIGYCWNPQQLERFMSYLESVETPGSQGVDMLVAGISPHDDYLYAGKVYYPLFKKMNAPEVVIFGVTHSTVRKKLNDPQNKVILDEFTAWKGPYKNIEISGLREYLKKNLDKELFMVSNEAHQLEHSIEGMLPFLQYMKRDVRITPIMVTAMPYDSMNRAAGKVADVLAAYIKGKGLKLGKDIFFLISADANHYGKDFDNAPFGEDESAHQKGTKLDKRLIRTFLAKPVRPHDIRNLTHQLWGKDYRGYGDTLWCGKYSVPFGVLTVYHLAQKLATGKKLTGKLFTYTDTYSEGVLPITKTGMGITAPFSLKHWVGFFSAGFYLK
jgi:AmmeMemoRadiSam system protein B